MFSPRECLREREREKARDMFRSTNSCTRLGKAMHGYTLPNNLRPMVQTVFEIDIISRMFNIAVVTWKSSIVVYWLIFDHKSVIDLYTSSVSRLRRRRYCVTYPMWKMQWLFFKFFFIDGTTITVAPSAIKTVLLINDFDLYFSVRTE